MKIKPIARIGVTVATVLLLAAGCATQADLDALRNEVAQLRADSKSITGNAAASAAGARAASDAAAASAAASAADARSASDAAAASAAAARAAADKADQIYLESMRK